MYLTKERYKEICSHIVNLFEDYNIHEMPISVKRIAKKMGIILQKYPISERERTYFLAASQDGFSCFNSSKKDITSIIMMK